MTIKYSELNLGQIEAAVNKLGGMDGLRRFLADELVVTERQRPASRPDVPLDTIIRVDRSIRPLYPDWMKKVMHPELEERGPSEYELGTVELWLHDGQKKGKWVKGQRIHDYLKKTDALKTCLGLRDGEEIQEKGIEVFRKVFGNNVVFLWASVVQDRDGDLAVPCLVDYGVEVMVHRRWLGLDWYDCYPAARFASELR